MAVTGIQVNPLETMTPEPSADYTRMVSSALGALYNPPEPKVEYQPISNQQTHSKFQIESYQPHTRRTSSSYRNQVNKYSAKYGIDPDLAESMMMVESGGNPSAKSQAGALGLMQLMPATSADIARKLGRTNYDILDPDTNIEFGLYYFKQKLDEFKGNVSLALAAYNAGSGNVRKHGGVPPFKETQNHVKKVLNNWNVRRETRVDMEKHGLKEYVINGKSVILHPSVAEKVMIANQNMIKQTGKGIEISSDYRSYTEQVDIWERSQGGKKFKAARPGKSNHQYGRAIDVSNWGPAEPFLRQVGLIYPMKDDKVHFSFSGR